MKNKFICLLLLYLVLFSSCKKNDCPSECISGTFYYSPHCASIGGIIHLDTPLDSITYFTVAGKDIPGFMKKSMPVRICFGYENYFNPVLADCSMDNLIKLTCSEKK